MKLIDKDALVAEIEHRKQDAINNCGGVKSIREHECDSCIVEQYEEMKNIINSLEVKEVDSNVNHYDACIQYTDRESAIKAHAEDYSWNIESELFQQLIPEQQKLWRKEIEQAVISGGYSGLSLAKDRRYDTLEVKEVDLEKEIDDYISSNFFGSQTMGFFANRTKEEPNDVDMALCAKYFFELGLKAQKGE